MAKLTPREIAEKQVKRSQAAVADYKKGVSSVTESPTAKAARKVGKYLAGVQKSVDDNSYVDGCNSVSKEDWIKAATEKGGQNYASGIKFAEDKILDFQTQIAPHRDRVQAQVNQMPDDTYEDRMAKMRANADGLHEFKYKRRKGG
jgi:ethanolamine ammonia-lyase large subunit